MFSLKSYVLESLMPALKHKESWGCPDLPFIRGGTSWQAALVFNMGDIDSCPEQHLVKGGTSANPLNKWNAVFHIACLAYVSVSYCPLVGSGHPGGGWPLPTSGHLACIWLAAEVWSTGYERRVGDALISLAGPGMHLPVIAHLIQLLH